MPFALWNRRSILRLPRRIDPGATLVSLRLLGYHLSGFQPFQFEVSHDGCCELKSVSTSAAHQFKERRVSWNIVVDVLDFGGEEAIARAFILRSVKSANSINRI